MCAMKDGNDGLLYLYPQAPLILAALSLIGSLYVQTLIANSQILTKQYEVTLKPKEDGYSRYMTSLYEAYSRAVHKDSDRMYTAIMEIENAYFAVEPFLDERERVSLWDAEQRFEQFCRDTLDADVMSKGRNTLDNSVKEFTNMRKQLRAILYQSLFAKGHD